MTPLERQELTRAAGKRYEAAYSAECKRFHREYNASIKRRQEIADAYQDEINSIGEADTVQERHVDPCTTLGYIAASLAGGDSNE